jgi:prepilin-type N-terminal cleavage/methylation domain-containing protein
MSRQGALEDERGFTLIELITVIVLLGIVLAISSSSWFGVVEGRQVDSATNQLAADLRQAHSRAINRLAPQTVELVGGSSEYTIAGGVASTLDLDDCDDEDVANGDCNDEDVVVVNTGATVAFCPNGSAEIPPPATDVCSLAPSGSPTTITVQSAANPTDYHNTIQINPVTSRIQVAP